MELINSFPEILKQKPIWILWRIEKKPDGSKTKIPYSANYDGKAKSNDPKTWSSFEKAYKKYINNRDQYNGLGVVISKEYNFVFIDIDHCIKDGVLSPIAKDILKLCPNQYVEISQSGSGLHILAIGEIPRNFKNSKNGVEMYSDKRICSLTGNILNSSEMHEDSYGLLRVFDIYKTEKRVLEGFQRASQPLTITDEEIIKRASSRGSKFALLYKGDWESCGYNSQSEADLSMCLILCFWCNSNRDAIDRIFRSSGLYREKWNRDDYRNGVLDSACSYTKETYAEYIARINNEERKCREDALFSKWQGNY